MKMVLYPNKIPRVSKLVTIALLLHISGLSLRKNTGLLQGVTALSIENNLGA
jgi:hypothetical protein